MGIAIIMAGILGTPFVFQWLWEKRWFRVCWWIGIVMMLGFILRAHRVLN